jgi:hypothetical protein
VKLTKAQSRQRWRQLRDLACGWDPIGVIPSGAPRDEYDCLIAPILRLLETGASEKEITQFLADQMKNHFGLKNVSDTQEFAKKVKTWYTDNWPGSTVQEGLAE